MEKKRENHLKLVKLKDAINLVNQEVNLLGIVVERREPKQCRNNDWIYTLRVIDDSYQSPGLTVNVFSNKLEELPIIKNHNDIILFKRIKMKSFDGGKRVNAACNKRVSSFALYQGRTGQGFVCYQCTSNFRDAELYMSSVDELGKLFASSSRDFQALHHTRENFSFLRQIKEGKPLDLLCKVLHVDEDMGTIFVWDGTDAPPASIGVEDNAFTSLSIQTLLSRDILLSFPTVGTILRVSLSNHRFHGVKPADWVKLYQLLCVFHKGSWIGKFTDYTTVSLAQDDPLVEKILRIYDKRISSKLGRIPHSCFPSRPGLTETDDDQAPFVTLMDIITFRKEYFWGSWFQNTEMFRTKWNRLLGIKKESSVSLATRSPPWIECCIFSYYTDKADPWKTRLYRIFGTRLLD